MTRTKPRVVSAKTRSAITVAESKRLILDLIGMIDYDIAKDLVPETAEEPANARYEMRRLVAFVQANITSYLRHTTRGKARR